MAWARGGDLFHLVSDRLLAASEEEDRLERELYEQAMDDGNYEAKEICVVSVLFTSSRFAQVRISSSLMSKRQTRMSKYFAPFIAHHVHVAFPM